MKKSKLLLTLVVVILVCSMLFTLIACNNDEKNPEPDKKPGPVEPQNPVEPEDKPAEPEGESEESQAAIDAFTEALEGAFAFEGEKVGFDYNIKVRVADVKEGEAMVARYINVALKGVIDPKTANNNKLQISANEVVGDKAPADVFTLFVDENDVYLINAKDKTATGKRVFPGLGLGAIVNGKTLDPSAVQGLIDTVAGVGGMFFTNGVQDGDAISVDLDLAALADFAGTALGSIVAGAVPEIENTVNGVFADLKNLAEKCTPTFTVVMKDSKIAEFKIAIDVIGDDGKEYNKVDVAIASKVGADVAPTFVAPAKADFIETNLLNFTLTGDFKMDQTYKFQIKADVDVFTVLKNLGVNGTADKAKLADIFAGSTTKLYADVKDAKGVVVAAAAVDFAVDGKVHAALNTTVPVFGKFVAPTKGDYFVYEAVVKDLLKAEIDKNATPAPAPAAAAEPAPETKPVDAKLVAKTVAKFVSFLTDIDYDAATYEVVLNGAQLVKALDALNAVVDVKANAVGGKEVLNLSEIVDLIPISDEIRIRVDNTSTFFDVANHAAAFKPVELFNDIFAA